MILTAEIPCCGTVKQNDDMKGKKIKSCHDSALGGTLSLHLFMTHHEDKELIWIHILKNRAETRGAEVAFTGQGEEICALFLRQMSRT